MITVIFETNNDEDRLARALVPLVSAATEGFVRDVIVLDHGSTDGTLAVADTAGCTLLKVGGPSSQGADKGADRAGDMALLSAARVARGDRLLMLRIDRQPLPQGWQDSARAHVEGALFRRKLERAYLWRGNFRRGIFGRMLRVMRLADGVLVPKGEILRT